MKKLLPIPVLLLALGFVLSCATPPQAYAPPPTIFEETPPPPSPPPPPPESVQDTGPVLSVSLAPDYFSPDGDGADDVLTVTLGAESKLILTKWKIEIHEPQPPFLLFSEWNGEGKPPASLQWDGRSNKGELVQSASDYPFTFSVTDYNGRTSVYEGVIGVDVLVIRDGDNLRVQVPSIVFGSNSGGFDGLDPEVIAQNDYILRRIAQVLNKFSTYQVKVEGHANPLATTAAARQREETTELQPLSQLRAKSVLDYLVNLGVDEKRLSAIGMGGSRPVVPYEDRDNWWKNRRVEFILVK
jgi:outer membrane protein OmpA-like peptidoglycan-associated protein